VQRSERLGKRSSKVKVVKQTRVLPFGPKRYIDINMPSCV
jgi:hypothetical protein